MRASAELLAATALACLGFAVMSGHLQSVDGLLAYRQAVSLVHDGALRFAEPVVWGQPIPASKYGLGLSLLYVPGLLLAFWVKPPAPTSGVAYDWTLLYGDPVYTVAGAWRHFDHWLAAGPTDVRAADLLWLRLASGTRDASLVPLALLLAAAAALAVGSCARASPDYGVRSRSTARHGAPSRPRRRRGKQINS